MFKLNLKRQRNQRSNCQNSLDHRESKGIQKNICFVDYTGAFDCVDYNKLWKTLKEMRIPDHLACLLRNLYVGQEAKGEKVEAVTSFLLLGSKSTVEVDCSHKIKKLLGRRAVTHLDSILNLPIKVCIIRATVFPVVMYGCES